MTRDERRFPLLFLPIVFGFGGRMALVAFNGPLAQLYGRYAVKTRRCEPLQNAPPDMGLGVVPEVIAISLRNGLKQQVDFNILIQCFLVHRAAYELSERIVPF